MQNKNNNQNIKEKIKKVEEKLNIKNIVISGLLVASLSLSGCASNENCDITEEHAHIYKSTKSFDRYIISEKEHINNFEKTESYMITTEPVKELLKFEQENKLFKIYLNEEKINEIIKTQEPYTEYRYKYSYFLPIPHVRKIGNATTINYTYIPKTGYSWTRETEGYDYTGETRTVKYLYHAYKVAHDENKNPVLIRSKDVENFEDLPGDFTYIKKDFYKVVNGETKKQLDYEEGQIEKRQEEEDIIIEETTKKDKTLVRTKNNNQ